MKLKKVLVCSSAIVLLICTSMLLFFNKIDFHDSLSTSKGFNKMGDYTGKSLSETGDYDIARIIMYDNITYKLSKEVITDEKIIGESFGTIMHQTSSKDPSGRKFQNGDSTMYPSGTKLYEIKGYDKSELFAVKDITKWVIYRSEASNMPTENIFTEDMLSAEKIVVSTIDGSGYTVIKSITDKNAILNIANCLKTAGSLSAVTGPASYCQKIYTYYFVITGSNGIGKITLPYTLYFENVDLNSYTYAGDYYKLGPDFNKLLTGPFGTNTTPYDSQLGGKQQIYECDLSTPKLTFIRYMKEPVSDKYQATLLGEGSLVWQNGVKVNDNLKGKYKLEIVMKDTKIQQKVMDKCIQNIDKFKGAVSISFTIGEAKDTTIMYIGFNDKPEFRIDEYGESFMLGLSNEIK